MVEVGTKVIPMACNRDLQMSRKNLFCDQCGEEVTVYALQPPLKFKACPRHALALVQKNSSVFDISAFDFVDTAKDYAQYVGRRDIAQKCQGTLTVLQERCEANRYETHNHLQTAKEVINTVVERSFQELQMQVDQRYQQIKEELNNLSVNLETFVSDKHSALPPPLEALSPSTPAGALFRVCGRDCSFEIVKILLENVVLLPEK